MKLFKRIAFGLVALTVSAAVLAQVASAVTITGTQSTQQNMLDKIGYLQLSVENAITATAGGGQANAYQLTNAYNRVTVVATGGDSVKLPALCNNGNVGMMVWVVNATAATSMNVFGQTGETINLIAANTAIAVVGASTKLFTCVAAGAWQSTTGLNP